MAPTDEPGGGRSFRTSRHHVSYSRSPSHHAPSDSERDHRRSKDASNRRSDRDAYMMDDAARRSRRDEDGERPVKRRRTSESPRRSRSRSPASRRHVKHERRSRSPYRKEDKGRRDRRDRDRSKSRDDDRRSKKEHTRRRSRDRSRSGSRHRRRRHGSDSRSPPPRKDRPRTIKDRSRSRSHHDIRSRKPLPDQEVAFKGETNPSSPSNNALDQPIIKQKPNYKPTGLLAAEANTVAGTKIVLKYNEPPEARKPPASQKWQLFVFKGDAVVDEVPLYTQSCWLLGREAAVADVHVEHPSASKQHAVVQFRHSVKTNEFGDKVNVVRPYVIDLESANGTWLNGERIRESRYYEIRDRDLVKVGLSEREYVFMLPEKI